MNADADNLTRIYSLFNLILLELERGHDVIIAAVPTSDGKPGRMRMPDGWEEFINVKAK